MKTELIGTEDHGEAPGGQADEAALVVAELVPDHMPNNE